MAENDEVAGADCDIVCRLVTELQRGTEEVVLVHLDEAFAVRLGDDVETSAAVNAEAISLRGSIPRSRTTLLAMASMTAMNGAAAG